MIVLQIVRHLQEESAVVDWSARAQRRGESNDQAKKKCGEKN